MSDEYKVWAARMDEGTPDYREQAVRALCAMYERRGAELMRAAAVAAVRATGAVASDPDHPWAYASRAIEDEIAALDIDRAGQRGAMEAAARQVYDADDVGYDQGATAALGAAAKVGA